METKRQYKAGSLKKERENLKKIFGVAVLFSGILEVLVKKRTPETKTICKTSGRGEKLAVTLGTRDYVTIVIFHWKIKSKALIC